MPAAAATTASLLGDGRALPEFWETSVVWRMCAQSGDDDLGSIGALPALAL